MKRLIALMAMLLLLVGSQSLMAVEQTVYFLAPANWAEVNVHVWKGSASTKWPGIRVDTGTPITLQNADDGIVKSCSAKALSDGTRMITCTIETGTQDFDHILFNYNGDANKTQNFALVDGHYYTSSDGAESTGKSKEELGYAENAYSYYLISDKTDWYNCVSNGLFTANSDGKTYSWVYKCTTKNDHISFRIRSTVKGTTTLVREYSSQQQKDEQNLKAGTPSLAYDRTTAGYTDNYWYVKMDKGNTYTFIIDESTPFVRNVSYTVTLNDVDKYEMVAKSQNTGETFVMDMSMSRVRNSGGYDTDLWTAGFKSDLLPGAVGDKFDIYIKKTTSSAVTYINPIGSLGNNQVDDLHLDYTNLESVNNILYNESDAPNANNTFTLTKKKDYSYTVALNLGSEKKRGWDEDENKQSYERTFVYAAKSMSLYVNQPLYKAYEKMYDGNGKAKYEYKKSDFYLIGQLDAAHYIPSNKAGYAEARDQAHLMKRNIYYKPGTEEVDSVVYSKVVMKPAAGFDGLFLSFAPKELLDDAATGGTKAWAPSEEGKILGNTSKEAYNYIVRPELFDSRDATAQMGAVFFRGVSGIGVSDADKMSNGSQALNPLLTSEQASENEYYIVRLNITTSTYRIEFLKREPIEISENGIRTYCGQTNLRIPTDLKDKFHIYAVQEYKKPEAENVEYGEKQGQLKLRALDYIPANEPVVLVVKDVTLPGAFNLEVMSDIDDDYKVNPEDWWKKKSYEDSYKNYLVGVLSKDKTIENGEYDINEQGKYVYRARNFALNKFSNTKYFKTLYPTDEERQEFKDAGKDYYSFFRAKGTVKAGYAYLQLPSNVLTFDGQLLDHQEDDSDVKTFAKMSLFFDDMGGDVTGIEEVKTSSNAGVREDGAYYTLQGMKVEKPVKGLYIHNGKKVIIK